MKKSVGSVLPPVIFNAQENVKIEKLVTRLIDFWNVSLPIIVQLVDVNAIMLDNVNYNIVKKALYLGGELNKVHQLHKFETQYNMLYLMLSGITRIADIDESDAEIKTLQEKSS